MIKCINAIYHIFMALFNPFALFKKGHIYGEILLFLYNNAEYRYELLRIKESISDVDIKHFYEVINWLLADNLIVTEVYSIENEPELDLDVYRISYQGFTFIKDLKEKRSSRIFNSISILTACLGIVIASGFNIINQHSISKIEVVKFPYRWDTVKQKKHQQ